MSGWDEDDWGTDELPAPEAPEAPELSGAVDAAPPPQAAVHEQANRAAGAAVSEQLSPAVPADDDGEAAPRLYYGSVDEFVREYLRNVYRRRVGGQQVSRKWAARWWQYDEAVIRLEALWRSWEHLRNDPATGMSVWWRDHADHHMAVLFDEAGPFAAAGDEEDNTNRKGEPLPYIAPPPGMFPDVREADPA